MTDPLATVTDYDGLIAALRSVVARRQLTHGALDEIAGVQSGYVSKLLAPVPMKHLGPMSFGAVLGALGVKLLVVDDPEATKRIEKQWTKRNRPAAVRTADTHPLIIVKLSRRRMQKLARLATVARRRIPKRKRIALARKAAKARWRRRHNYTDTKQHE